MKNERSRIVELEKQRYDAEKRRQALECAKNTLKLLREKSPESCRERAERIYRDALDVFMVKVRPKLMKLEMDEQLKERLQESLKQLRGGGRMPGMATLSMVLGGDPLMTEEQRLFASISPAMDCVTKKVNKAWKKEFEAIVCWLQDSFMDHRYADSRLFDQILAELRRAEVPGQFDVKDALQEKWMQEIARDEYWRIPFETYEPFEAILRMAMINFRFRDGIRLRIVNSEEALLAFIAGRLAEWTGKEMERHREEFVKCCAKRLEACFCGAYRDWMAAGPLG